MIEFERLYEDVTVENVTFRVKESTGGDNLIVARKQANQNASQVALGLELQLRCYFVLENDKDRPLKESEFAKLPQRVMTKLQDAFNRVMAVADPETAQQNAAVVLLELPNVPTEARDWLESLLPNEADRDFLPHAVDTAASETSSDT